MVFNNSKEKHDREHQRPRTMDDADDQHQNAGVFAADDRNGKEEKQQDDKRLEER
jgi:hypothetical protein